MRKLSILACFILLTSPLAITQANAATPKLGGACSKVGSFGDTPKVRFICVKSGKKLVWQQWNKSSSNNNSTSNNASSTSCPIAGSTKIVGGKRYMCVGTGRQSDFLWDAGTPVSFAAKIPISLPVAQDTSAGGITFSNVMSHIVDIPKVAWQRVQDVIAANPPLAVPHTLAVGPNTTSVTKTLEESLLKKEFQLWEGFQQTTYLNVVLYNTQDIDWATSELQAVFKAKGYVFEDPSGFSRIIKQPCQQSETAAPGQKSGVAVGDCFGGAGGSIPNSSDSMENLGVTTAGKWDPTDSGEVSHEYTHTVQAAQWIGTAAKDRGDYGHIFAPCWINEGQPNATGIAASSKSYQQYLDKRNATETVGPLDPKFPGWSAANLKEYLYSQIPNGSVANSCYQNGPLYQMGYSVGMAATEALVAIGGPQSTMALYARGADGDSFAEAFQKVYGISWDEGSTILGQILAAEYAVKPLKTSN